MNLYSLHMSLLHPFLLMTICSVFGPPLFHQEVFHFQLPQIQSIHLKCLSSLFQPLLSRQVKLIELLVKLRSYIHNSLRPRLHEIGSKWDRIHLDPIHFLRSVYTGSDPELFAFTRDRIHLDFMNSWQRSIKHFLLF